MLRERGLDGTAKEVAAAGGVVGVRMRVAAAAALLHGAAGGEAAMRGAGDNGDAIGPLLNLMLALCCCFV